LSHLSKEREKKKKKKERKKQKEKKKKDYIKKRVDLLVYVS
jgi:hypothetical protein